MQWHTAYPTAFAAEECWSEGEFESMLACSANSGETLSDVLNSWKACFEFSGSMRCSTRSMQNTTNAWISAQVGLETTENS